MTEPTGLIDPPAPRPCATCPYRLDVPSGVWEFDEYLKLFDYDLPTQRQPAGVFCCHNDPGRVCAGWADAHADEDNLALRVALSFGTMTPEAAEETIAYTSPVPCFALGAAAAFHGLAKVADPPLEAVEAGDRILRRRPSITCPVCDRTSINPHDVREGYCGNCHAWTSPSRAEINREGIRQTLRFMGHDA